MTKEAVFTMKLEASLRDEFMSEVHAVHRPASQVVREFMREFIGRQRDARAYHEFLKGKVDAARSSARDGLGRSNEDVEGDFDARRTQSKQRV